VRRLELRQGAVGLVIKAEDPELEGRTVARQRATQSEPTGQVIAVEVGRVVDRACRNLEPRGALPDLADRILRTGILLYQRNYQFGEQAAPSLEMRPNRLQALADGWIANRDTVTWSFASAAAFRWLDRVNQACGVRLRALKRE